MVVEGLIERVAHHLKVGDKAQFTGFGTFEVWERNDRTGVNPRTGEKINILGSVDILTT